MRKRREQPIDHADVTMNITQSTRMPLSGSHAGARARFAASRDGRLVPGAGLSYRGVDRGAGPSCAPQARAPARSCGALAAVYRTERSRWIGDRWDFRLLTEDRGRGPAESFLRFSPPGPQAFARFYGTIQRGSATGLYVEGRSDPVGPPVGEFGSEIESE